MIKIEMVDGRENRFSLSNNDYKKAKRRLIISYTSIPFLICVLIFMFLYVLILYFLNHINNYKHYICTNRHKNNINIVKEGKEKMSIKISLAIACVISLFVDVVN